MTGVKLEPHVFLEMREAELETMFPDALVRKAISLPQTSS